MPLVLRTLARDPSIDSTGIDQNWIDIEELVNLLETMLQQGAVTIISSTTDAQGRLVLGLSNGTTLPPVPLGSQPIRVMGEWQSGLDYQKGDIVNLGGSSYIVSTAHTSGDFEADLTAGLLAILAAKGDSGSGGGGGGSGAQVHRFERLGSLQAAGDDGPTIGFMVMPADCEIAADVVVAVGTPVSQTGASFEVVLSKIAALDGAETELGTVDMLVDARLGGDTIVGAFAAGDVLKVRQRWAAAADDAEDITVSVTLAPPAA